jgi:hypothetical protein
MHAIKLPPFADLALIPPTAELRPGMSYCCTVNCKIRDSNKDRCNDVAHAYAVTTMPLC